MTKKKVVLVTGKFNVLHPGHLRLFRFAKENGDYLIVGVEGDALAGEAAHIPEELRIEGIKANNLVDEAFIIREPIEELLLRLKPDIVVKGKEHESRHNIESNIVDLYGGKLMFSSGETFFSSIDLLRKELQDEARNRITLPFDFIKRHDIRLQNLLGLLDKFKKLKVCVIGDFILDQYIACQPLGMSQEDPVIVVTPLDSVDFIGGAGIVAAHAGGLGSKVTLLSVTGDDQARKNAIQKLDTMEMRYSLFVDETRPTTFKQRYRSGGRTLFRVSHLHQDEISTVIQDAILESFNSIADEIDLLVFSDFNYGCLPQNLVDKVAKLAKDRNILMVADSQSSSQTGDIARFNGMHLITPTEHEARISTRNHKDGLVILAEQLRQNSHAENILLTMNAEGLLIHSVKPSNGWVTDRVEALNSSPVDVSGAGDSLLITSAMTLAAGGSIWEAACLGSIAAAIQVGRVGNNPLNHKDISSVLNQ